MLPIFEQREPEKIIIYNKCIGIVNFHCINKDLIKKSFSNFKNIKLSKKDNYYFPCVAYSGNFCPFCYVLEKITRKYYQTKNEFLKLVIKNINRYSKNYYLAYNVNRKKFEVVDFLDNGDMYNSDYLLCINRQIKEIVPSDKIYSKVVKLFENKEKRKYRIIVFDDKKLKEEVETLTFAFIGEVIEKARKLKVLFT